MIKKPPEKYLTGGKNKAQPWKLNVYLDIHFSPTMSN